MAEAQAWLNRSSAQDDDEEALLNPPSAQHDDEEATVAGVEFFYERMAELVQNPNIQKTWYDYFEQLPGLVFSATFFGAGAWCVAQDVLVHDADSLSMAWLCLVGGVLTFLLLVVCMYARGSYPGNLMALMISDWEEYNLLEEETVGPTVLQVAGQQLSDLDNAILKVVFCRVPYLRRVWLVIRWIPIFYPIWWYARIAYFPNVAFKGQVDSHAMGIANGVFNLGYLVVIVPIIGALCRPLAVTFMCVNRIRKKLEDDRAGGKKLEERYWYKLKLKVHYVSTLIEKLWHVTCAGLPWVVFQIAALTFCFIGANIILGSADVQFNFGCCLLALGSVLGVSGLVALASFHKLCMGSSPCAKSLYAAAYRFHLGSETTKKVHDADYNGHDIFVGYLLNNPMAIRLGGFVVTWDGVLNLLINSLIGLPSIALVLKKMRDDMKEDLFGFYSNSTKEL